MKEAEVLPACLLHAGHVIANKHRDKRNAFILFLHAITRVWRFCLQSVKIYGCSMGVSQIIHCMLRVDGIL
jgi:hypothetical protein